MNDKIKPVEERIAELFGKTTYRDFRDGFGGTRSGLTSLDVAHALGGISTDEGELIPLVLETHYAMTLRHERELCEGWNRFFDKTDPHADKQDKSFSRLACALAVRELAGVKHTDSNFAHYAWIACTRKQSLKAAVWLIASWFDDLCTVGTKAIRAKLKNVA